MDLTAITSELSSLPPADTSAQDAVRARADAILRPSGALARLDEVAVWMAGWQRSDRPAVYRPAAIVFAADHGVVTEGVSAYPAEVTSAMLAAFEASKASVSALAGVAGATVTAIDVGVGDPTGNLRIESAMDVERFDRAFAAGRDAVRAINADLLIFGEMGIGNTTAAAAVCAALLGQDALPFVGRGTGIDDDGLDRKRAVVSDAVERIADVTDPLEILRQVGGAELAAIAGGVFQARSQSIPVLLDGYIATSPVLALHAVDPTLTEHCWAGHCSAEPGHARVLEHLGLEPLLTLDMRLGEASGAMASVPLVKMACAVVTDVPTFPEWFGPEE